MQKYDKSIADWCDKVIDKEFNNNKEKYCKEGCYGATITIAKRLDNSFDKTNDIKKKTFLSKCANYINDTYFD